MKSLSITLPLTLSLLLFKNINLSVGQRAMNTLAGIYSVAYVTVPDDQVAKKLAQ